MTSSWHLNINQLCVSQCWIYLPHSTPLTTPILTSILNNKFGIDDTAFKWFYSYLQPRSFKVAVNGKYSEEKQLTYIVLQGSCSGANPFNLYCSTLNDVVPLDLH